MKASLKISTIIVLSAFIVALISFNSCEVEFFDDEPATTGSGVVLGYVTDQSQNGLADVQVSSGDKVVHSASDGTFILSGIPVKNNRTITFSLDGYATNQKVTDVVLNDTSYVRASLGAWAISADYPSDQNNTVSFQNATVKLTANSFVDENGQAVNGNITVSAAYFDPTDSTYADVFPGDFIGEDVNGNEVAIESFGFINVEITQGDKELDLAPGVESEIIIPLPGSIANNAPATIPLWYFDEEMGTWIEEGSATLQNGSYVGNVSHFTSWNCDAGMDASAQIKGKVTCYDGTPIADAKVIITGLDFVNTTTTKTGNDGTYSSLTKPNSKAKVVAQIITPNGTTLINSQTVVVNTGGIGSTVTTENLLIDCGDSTSNSSYSFIYDVYSVDNSLAWSVGENGRIFYYNKNETNDLWISMHSGTTEALYAIDCPSFDKFWVVGSNGTVLQSTDFGQTWQAKFIGTDADLQDVEFIFKYGWIGGTTGKFFRTTDGGNTWNQINTGTVQTIYDISFINKDEGWLCGSSGGSNGLIMHTIDGGQNWTQQNSIVQENLTGIKFVTSLKGWAVGDNGTIIRTENGGQTWTSQISGTFEDLHAIDFVDIDGGNGYIVGDNGVVKQTEDAGESWINAWLGNYYPQNSMYAVDISLSDIVWFGGDDEIFWKGATRHYPSPSGWTRRDATGIGEDIRDIFAVSETEVWMTGNNGTVINSVDAGINWNIHTGFQNDLLCIEKVGSFLWIGGGNGTFWKSNDDGQNWTQYYSFPGNESILKMEFTSPQKGWSIVGQKIGSDVDNVNRIYKSDDGGQNWSLVDNLPDGNSGGYTDLFFLNENIGWIIKTPFFLYPAQVFKTMDGGNTWNAQILPYSDSHSSATFFTIDGTYLWLLGWAKTIYTAESNQIWYSQENDILGGKKLMFTDFNTGWCIGHGDNVYKSVNTGRTWEKHELNPSGGSYEIYALQMVNNNIGWAAGKNGYIFYTNTGGE